jgi:hypothetical protein
MLGSEGLSGRVATSLLPGACAVGAGEGVQVANGVFALSHLRLVGHSFSVSAQLIAAKVEAKVA